MLLTIPLVSHLIAAVTILFLGIIVYFHDRRSITNVVFFLHTLVITFWTIANYFSITVSPETALVWIRLVVFFATPHVFLFFLFIYVFPETRIDFLKNWERILFFSLLVLTAVIPLSPYGFKNTEIVDGDITPIPGILMPVFGAVIVTLSLWTVALVIKKYRRANLLRQRQYAMIFTGLIFSYALLITLVFLAVNLFGVTYFVQYSPLFIVPMIAGSAYAILRHSLFNVKVIATETLTYAIVLITFLQVFLPGTLGERIVRIVVLSLLFLLGVLLVRSVLREVEQRERMERMTAELEHVNERLKELDHLKSEFLNFASHQVKSPMATVKGFATLIEDGTYGQASEQVKEGAHRIKGAADRLISLVNNLLDLGKIESGKLDFTMQEMDIVRLLTVMVDEYQVLAQGKKLILSFETDKPSLTIKADAEKLRQVIQNLIDNAIKYTDTPSTGSGQAGWVKVAFKDEYEKNTVLISVMDSGRGMSAELLQKLFGRFVRDEKTKTEVIGTGLGLYIAKQIVLTHHGEIWAESEGVGKGSKFFVRIGKING